jgi:glycosyltransferase involved in cell wall biosynthesis
MSAGVKKLKIVWICHFMNQAIKEKLGIDIKENEFAPWITLGLNEIRKRDDIELFVLAPFYKILRNRYFSDKNIHYSCIKVGIPFIKTSWPWWFRIDLWTNFIIFNWQVRYLVNKINPDLVNLQGAENPYYSASILGIRNFPVLVTIQGFITLHNYKEISHLDMNKRLKTEEKILKRMNNFGIEASFMEEYIRSFNPGSNIFFYHCPYARPLAKTGVEKEYDIVYFASLSKMKGIEDLIRAVSIVKNKMPQVTLLIIGRGNKSYVSSLRDIIRDNNLKNNIIFRGFIPLQQEMHEEAGKARISVLPTYNDTIAGTIVESMFLRLPVISYNVGGNPDLNKNGENVLLVEKGNIEGLAKAIEQLLEDEERRTELSEKAFNFVTKEFDNSNSIQQLVNTYSSIVAEAIQLN